MGISFSRVYPSVCRGYNKPAVNMFGINWQVGYNLILILSFVYIVILVFLNNIQQ